MTIWLAPARLTLRTSRVELAGADEGQDRPGAEFVAEAFDRGGVAPVPELDDEQPLLLPGGSQALDRGGRGGEFALHLRRQVRQLPAHSGQVIAFDPHQHDGQGIHGEESSAFEAERAVGPHRFEIGPFREVSGIDLGRVGAAEGQAPVRLPKSRTRFGGSAQAVVAVSRPMDRPRSVARSPGAASDIPRTRSPPRPPARAANRWATRWLTISSEAARKSVRGSRASAGLWKMNRMTSTRSSTGPWGERYRPSIS